jgi:hypothetical protein
MEKSFQIGVDCNLGGTPHKHTITVEHGPPALGASRPTNVRLQYICPTTGTAGMVTFQPPVGVGKPLNVVDVS